MESESAKIKLSHPKLTSALINIPAFIAEDYFKMCDYNYIEINGYGEFPIQRLHCAEMMRNYIGSFGITDDNYWDIIVVNVMPELSEYAKGFAVGYNKDFTPFIDTIEARKETVFNIAFKGHRGLLHRHKGDNVEFVNLFDSGFYEGERYKAWEIILQSPNEFKPFFSEKTPRPESQEPPKANDEKPKQFDLNLKSLSLIFQFCIDTAVFSADLTNSDFITSIAEADFKALFEREGTTKTKLKYIIFIIHHFVAEREWYKTAATSIGVTPNACSGANVGDRNDNWKNKAKKLIQIK